MAFNFNKLNKANGVRPEGLDTEGFEYTGLKEYVDEVVPVVGFFFTSGEYGKQVVVITDDCFVNMPSRAVEEFEAIAADPEAEQAVLDGELVLTDIEPIKTKKGNSVAYKFGNASEVKKDKKRK